MVLILMGVSGSGKTTVGLRLSKALGCPFLDADDYHSTANQEKMSKGIPLSDEDRESWLADLAVVVKLLHIKSPLSVLACSALRQKYRDRFSGESVCWVYLKGDRDLIARRLRERTSHFMGEALLASQFETLEEPTGAITVDIRENLDIIVADLIRRLKEGGYV